MQAREISMVSAQRGGNLVWYVVVTKPRQELVAQTNLERQGYSTLLPRLRLRKRQRGKWQEVTEPTFPGYVFVAVELGLSDTAPIRSTQGCRDLIRFGEQPAAVPSEIIRALQSATHSQLMSATKLTDPFSPGDVVVIEDGPFQGLSAIYKMNNGADRVQVLLTILGSPQLVSVGIDMVSR